MQIPHPIATLHKIEASELELHIANISGTSVISNFDFERSDSRSNFEIITREI